MTEPGPGAVVGSYRLERLIGRGGMGVVYLAEHVHLERKVALKLLGEHLAADDSFRARFLRESRTAAKLDHPNVVTVFDAGESAGLLYLAMRYVEGTDLKAILRQRGPLDPRETIAILEQIASALDAAHALGLVHRDVKPGNILISEVAPGTRAYLGDFGLTRGAESVSDITQAGAFIGSIDYAAPEQWKNHQLGAPTDVYALGCVLFECLTGQVPYNREGQVAVMYGHMFDAPPHASALNELLPGAIDDVIRTALAKSPSDRFDSCGGLIAAAADALASSERPTPAPGAPTQPPGDERKDTFVRPSMGEALKTAPLAGAHPGPRSTPLPPTAQSGPAQRQVAGMPVSPTERGRSGKRPELVALIAILLVAAVAGAALLFLDDDEKSNAGAPAAAPGAGSSGQDLITFRSDRDGDDEIFVMNARGKGVTKLTDNRAADSDPSWSPDGNQIAFQSNRDGDWDVYVMSADGSDVTNLTNNSDADTDPAWAPDNRLIAFSSDREGNPDIFVMTPGGTGVANLTQRPSTDDDPAWSSDSRTIAFQSDIEGNDDVVEMESDGAGPRNLTKGNKGPDQDPDFSPTEDAIALARLDDVFVLTLESGDLDRVSSGPSRESDPVFSDDGTQLVFQSDRDGDEDLYLAALLGGKPTNLTNNEAFDADPDWLP